VEGRVKRWVVAFVSALGLVASTWYAVEQLNQNDRDICFVLTPAPDEVEGEVVALKPGDSDWSEWEQGVYSLPSGKRLAVHTFELTEAELNSINATHLYEWRVECGANTRVVWVGP
jgi:hypothetical protein